MDEVVTVDPIAIRLHPTTVDAPFKWQEETVGALHGVLELALADLPGVVPFADGAEPAPGLTDAPLDDAERWDVFLELAGGPTDLTWRAMACREDHPCAELRGRGTREQPQLAASELVRSLAGVVGRPVGDAWSGELSVDPYAVLLGGRSAALRYGLLPPVATKGHVRWDPTERAVRVDPANGLAQWLLGRQRMERGDAAGAAVCFSRARESMPWSTGLAAAHATALGDTAAGEAIWNELDSPPLDPRFGLPHARTLHAQGRADEAHARLVTLGEAGRAHPGVARLFVELARELGQDRDLDANLAAWQAVDPDAEPVRQRVALRVAEGRLAPALELVDELDRRSEDPLEAPQLEVALLCALGRWAEAEAVAETAGLPTWSSDDAPTLDAEAQLRAAAAVLRSSPWDRQALMDQLEAERALGRPSAARTQERLALLDPDWEG